MPRAVMSQANPSAQSGIPIKAALDLNQDLDPKLLVTSKVTPTPHPRAQPIVPTGGGETPSIRGILGAKLGAGKPPRTQSL